MPVSAIFPTRVRQNNNDGGGGGGDDDDDAETLNMDDMRVELANLIVQRRLYRRLELESLFARAIRAAEPNELNVAAVTLVVDEFREALGLSSVPVKAQIDLADIVQGHGGQLGGKSSGSDLGDEKGTASSASALRTSTDGSTLRVVSAAWDSLKKSPQKRGGEGGAGDGAGEGDEGTMGDVDGSALSVLREAAEDAGETRL